MREQRIVDTQMCGDRRTAAVFRKSVSAQSSHPVVLEALALLTFGLLRRVHPDQGLLIGTGLYKEIGGHREAARDPEADWSGAEGLRVLRYQYRTNYPIGLSVDDLREDRQY